MATDTERALRGMVRTGTVSAVFPERDTARVTFDDKDGTSSPELHILHRYSGKNKDYWIPDIGDQALCLFNNNDKNFSTGWILGTYFTDKQPPQVASPDIMRLDFADGTYIEYDRSSSTLTVNVAGPVIIKGATISLN
nr:phage baseplate assembly protein V [Mitsuokella multacida]